MLLLKGLCIYPKVPIALLKGFDLRTTSGVNVPPTNGSSAARSSESMLKELSDPHAEVCFPAKTGVADTRADKYFSCKMKIYRTMYI